VSIWNRITTKHLFDDGAKISLAHKYALKYEANSKTVAIGFEPALKKGVDRLIHKNSIEKWIDSDGEKFVTPAEKDDILERVQEYCNVKRLTYRIVD
jgi:hypothetical protein